MKYKLIGMLASIGFLMSAQVFAVAGFSEANNALFDSPHMKNVASEGILHYAYKKESYIEDSTTDTVDLAIKNIRNTGRSNQHFEFFTGENKRPYLDRDNQSGNGVFVMFLEWDVHELERQTKGSWRHFQRRIRWALAGSAVKTDVMVDYKGEQIKAVQYSIKPYANDKNKTRYGLYANKYYIFTLSDDIPGTIYQIRTIVPDGKVWKEGDAVLTDERITFTGFTSFAEMNTEEVANGSEESAE